MRRFATFSLLTPEAIATDEPTNNIYRYTATVNHNRHWVEINHLTRAFTAHDLMGFNNTGNVCVWPSEESLAFYALNNLNLFRQSRVLELGSGMSALGGLMVAKYANPKLVHLTDGNHTAVSNIAKSLQRNNFSGCEVSCSVLQWGKSPVFQKFDVILSADCLFFDEARNDLVDTIYDFLTGNGLALVMAPKRGGTLEIFARSAQLKGFRCEKSVFYNEAVWDKHLESMDRNVDYDEDLHYPILLKLTKI